MNRRSFLFSAASLALVPEIAEAIPKAIPSVPEPAPVPTSKRRSLVVSDRLLRQEFDNQYPFGHWLQVWYRKTCSTHNITLIVMDGLDRLPRIALYGAQRVLVYRSFEMDFLVHKERSQRFKQGSYISQREVYELYGESDRLVLKPYEYKVSVTD